jgi:AGZA family xanthine/uracil permease-like MFS transporter
MIKQNRLVSGVSMASALIVYFATNDLIWTIAVSVILSTIAHLIRAKVTGDSGNTLEVDMSKEKFIPLKLTVNPHIVRSVLAVCTLQIGGNIAYATITAGIAGDKANVDAITVYSGLADSASSFFGGGPVEAIISGTAAAPHPLLSGVLLAAIVSAIFLTKTITKIAKYIPAETISGFLFTLGAFAVFPSDAASALSEDPVVGGCVIIVTSFSDPFIGMVSGIVLKYAIAFLGGF